VRPASTEAVGRGIAVLLVLALGPGAATSPDAPRLGVRGLSHVAFRVSRLADSRRFYEGLLGLGVAAAPGVTDGRALVRIDDRQYLELVPGLDPAEDRLDHVALEVDDVRAARRALDARGVPASQGPGSLEIRDPEGHRIELVERRAATTAENGAAVSRRLLHAGIIVGALEDTRRFYEQLGFREIWRGSRSGTELSWTNMQVPDGEDYLEFMLYGVKPAANERGTQHHVCLEVPDVEAACRVLQARASDAGYSRPLEVRTGTNRRRQLNLYDPDGTRVELMEPRTVDGQPVPSSTAPPPRQSR
jgi:catechol 2,3-dioxygenase-like lactoylglutathione lyase family enzyme